MEEETVSKITFDQLADFKFIAAYEVYSKLFDNTDGTEDRRKLNNNISQLFNTELSYHHFYNEINHNGEAPRQDRKFHGMRIKGLMGLNY